MLIGSFGTMLGFPSLRWEDLLGYGILNENPDANTAQNVELEAAHGERPMLWRTRSATFKLRPSTHRSKGAQRLQPSRSLVCRACSWFDAGGDCDGGTERLKQVPGRFQVVSGSATLGSRSLLTTRTRMTRCAIRSNWLANSSALLRVESSRCLDVAGIGIG